MHSPQKPYEVRYFFSKNFRFLIFIIQISFQNSLAASLPGLEVTGERIPTPKNWSRDECSEIIVQDPADDNLYGTHDVETPYMVESWLKGKLYLSYTVLQRTQTRPTWTNPKFEEHQTNIPPRMPTVKLKTPGKEFFKSESRSSVTFKL